MIEPYPIKKARHASEDTIANRFIKVINEEIERGSKCNKHECVIKVYGMDAKISEANRGKNWTFGLLGEKAEELLKPDEQEVLKSFRNAGYLVKCCAYASYSSSTYEEGWDFQYTIVIKW